MVAIAAAVGSGADQALDALRAASAGWMAIAVCLHFAAQLARGCGWYHALDACWPGVPRRRACAWYLCGAGLSGVLSGRGGDAVRIAGAKAELPAATWPALAGTAVVEGAVQALVGLIPVVVVIATGVQVSLPSPGVAGAVAAAVVVCAVLAVRSRRARRTLAQLASGCAALRGPRRRTGRILGWELLARLLRLGAVSCFLLGFGLPATPAVIATVSVLYGSGATLPIPAAGTAASAGALLLAIPAAAGHPVDPGAVSALVIVQPLLLTTAGVAVSLVLLANLLHVRTPRALLRARRALVAQPAGQAP
jgi:hypothetical protein